MINKLKNLFHFFVRKLPNFFALIYAIIFIFFVKKVSNKKKYERKVLILNKERFWDDLLELDKSGKLQFIYFDKKRISLLTEPFVKTIRHQMPSTFWRDYKEKDFFKDYLDKHSKFIFYFLKYFDLFYKFDSIITPSLWYLQDRSFERGADLLKKKFIFLHKENTTDLDFYENLLQMYNNNTIKFENFSSIIVYNDNTKKVIADTKKINQNKIFNLGCPRIDNLINLKKDNPKNVTLCSFTYKLGISFINSDISHPFATKDPNLKLYFDTIHLAFIELALKHKETQFIIKIKPNLMWKKLIEDLIIKKEENLKYKITNLKIISNEFTMSEVLKKSRLVIGINSLSLVEARIIGIPCIFPNFNEISNYKDKLYFREYFGNEITLVEDLNELNTFVENNLNTEFRRNFTELNKKFTEEYFGYSDGKNTERYINFLLNI